MHFVIVLLALLSGCNDVSQKNNELATIVFIMFISYVVLSTMTQWLFSSKTLVHIKEWVNDVLIPYVVPTLSILFIIFIWSHLNSDYHHPTFIVLLCVFLCVFSIKQKFLTDQDEKQRNVKMIVVSMSALGALTYLFFYFGNLSDLFG